MNPRDILQKCPFCQTTYEPTGITALTSNERLFRFHCVCIKCGRSVVSFLTELAGWISAVGMLTELNASEAKNLPASRVIDADVCVQAHRFFEEHSQELCRFLQKQPKNRFPQRS